MLLRGWLGLIIGWGTAGAVYGFIVALRVGLAGAARDSLLLMAYVAGFFIVLGSALFLLRAGIRALLGLLGGKQPPDVDRSLPARTLAALGGFIVVFAALLAAGDLLITASFRADTSRAWLITRDVLFLATGGVLCWLLCGPAARRVDGLLVRLRDPRGWKILTAGWVLLLILAMLSPMLGASSPRWERERGDAPEDLVVEDTGLRVVVAGVDAATWKVYRPLMEAGLLPTQAQLVADGVMATPVSPPPQVSPAIWTTMSTGRPPAEHGVHEYLLVSFPGLAKFPFEALAKDMTIVPFFFVGISYFLAGVAEGLPPTSRQVRTKSLWHMVADGGGESLILGWPCTYPAEPVPGLIVSDRFGPNEFDLFSRNELRPAGSIHPPDAEERLRPLMTDSGGDSGPMLDRLLPFSAEEKAALDRLVHNPMLPRPLSLLTTVYDADMSYLAFLENEITHRRYRLATILLNGPDLAMHVFWQYRFPEDFGLTGSEKPGWGRIIDAFHRLVDERLARVLTAAGPDTVVIVVSDHGMAADPGNPVWPGWHAPEGLFIMAGGPVQKGLQADALAYTDIAPTVLYLLGYPVPDDLGGRVLTEFVDEAFIEAHPVRTIPTYETAKAR